MKKRVIIKKHESVNVILNKLNFEPVKDQKTRGEDTIYWLIFTFPNGKATTVHICKDGWQFTGGPKRKYTEGLLEILVETIKEKTI